MVVNNKNHPQKKIIKHAQFTPHDLSLFNFQAFHFLYQLSLDLLLNCKLEPFNECIIYNLIMKYAKHDDKLQDRISVVLLFA